MEYLKIKNWDKWQSYRKDRGQPPWIKIHRRLLRNPEWVMLTDAERGQLLAVWILAADRDGEIPASPEIVQKLCYLDKKPNINKFIELGFIAANGCHNDAKVTPEGRQGDRPEAEAEAEEEKNNITANFDDFYGKYPNKKNKGAAKKAWKKLKPTKDLLQTMLTAIDNQKAEHEAFNMAGEWHAEWPHPSTWLNNARWEDEIVKPQKKESKDEWDNFCRTHPDAD